MQDSLHLNTLVQAFEWQAARRNDAVAINLESQSLSYCALNERANQLAHRLQKMGVGPEVPVALYLERSLDMVVAILGVLKAGGCYVPMDLAYPKERIAFMLEDTAAPVLLTQQALLSQLPSSNAKVICLDSAATEIASEPITTPESKTGRDNAAYIIYTSGSTGKPKGVIVTHHNVLRLLDQTKHWYQFNTQDVWPLFHSYAFDVSVWELWASLLFGGRLVIVPYLISRSPHDFHNLLAREKVTVLNQTPSAFRQLIWAETTAANPADLNLRYVVCAGEALELQSLKPWFERHGDQRPKIVNMYGITETTVHSTYRVITKKDLENNAGSVIGVPIPDLQIYLVDENLQPVPKGEVGEIIVGGDGVARGYKNRDDLTKRRFLPDPFSGKPGARMYRSGDLAKISETDEMEYLGRMDHQVKIRGFRVELGEIESALNRHPAIRESVVILQDSGGADKRLVGYIVPVAEAPNISELREFLGKFIPDYMIPAVFVVLPSLPLTTNGKVDRRALPAYDGSRPTLDKSFVAPRNDAEKTLAAIWSEVLGVKQVGALDNFFELGGDSIRSISVLSRAQQKGLVLSLPQMFEHPTVAAMAACATASAETNSTARPSVFSLISSQDRTQMPADVEDAYPIARLQLGMFFHNEFSPLSAAYHDVFSFQIQAPCEEEKLETALHRLIQRHPILRTSFHIAGYSEPLELVHREAPVHLTVEDLRNVTPDEQGKRVVQWIEEEKRRPFDRTTAPLVRFHAQVHGDKSFQFIISFHHVCLDGWSLAAVLTEIFQDYAAFRSGKEAAIPAPRAMYRDFVALEKKAIASQETRDYWMGLLANANLQTLPRWPHSLCAGGHEQNRGPEIILDTGIVDGLKNLGRQAGVPLKSVLLAAHQRVMSLLYGQNDVTSGLLCNGRPEDVDGEKVIGLFLNTLPFRSQLTGGSWLELVKQTFTAEQKLSAHRRLPLSEVHRLNGGRAVFEAAFDFVHFHVYNNLQGCDGLDLREGCYFEANDLTSFTTFMLDAAGTRLELHIDYDPNVICRQQIEEMSSYYVNTLRAMAVDPNSRYDQFSPLSETESERILVQWNRTTEDYPREKCIHELFEARAKETPSAPALTVENTTWTYAELNEQADRVAVCLTALKIGPESLVAICIDRSPEMLAGLLGILKAGAAYVPMDPAYPAERLAFMLEDANVGVVLTRQNLAASLPKTNARIICIDAIEDAPVVSPARRACPQDLAYVIYTSGSTGKPKGVQVTHQAVVNLLVSAGKTIDFTAKDNLLGVTTLSFDIAGLELFLPLISGAKLTLATQEVTSDGQRLAELIASSGATVMQATPTTWRLLIESGWNGKPDLRVLCGGEALSRALADDLSPRVKSLWNFYGPTETTIWSTAWKVVPNEPISIGRPLANTQLYILDSKLAPVPPGVTGELHIGGDGLARGYLGRPQLTAEKFIPNPFCKDPGARLYKTGDWARYSLDGRVECLGRIDQQVKIRGFRIELGEIEAVLRQHSGIANAVVTARESESSGKRLVGYLVSKNGPPSVLELREFVQSRLPAYMVPAQFVVLPEFPLTPNGKIDVRRLPAPEESAARDKDYVGPRDEHEKALAEIWQEVLAVKQVSIDDDVFALGADSLSATRAFARINRKFGINLPLKAIFENRTVAALAPLVRNAKPEETRRPSIKQRRSRIVPSAKPGSLSHKG
jgi:amino acid adenylation domain-containing protein